MFFPIIFQKPPSNIIVKSNFFCKKVGKNFCSTPQDKKEIKKALKEIDAQLKADKLGCAQVDPHFFTKKV